MLKIFKNKSVKFGIPFLVFMLGAPFLVNEFQRLRYEYKPLIAQDVLRDEMKKKGLHMKKPGEVTLESEYAKIKDKDTSNWEIKRIPRPYEEPETK
ncbi:cytochrome c oxidase assembly protein COX16 homolog, mitochondrial [Leptopilina heterotoma]|uniref:cytochrome c oxidase assembly protein COX16 homolog, mitochondrial n=1 Tax=Leptopilina heterotoma TaxID=63436 RepID=UPI001CA85B54|nr:cytochrome c oxidase assembly protein COX16 homolog, mitochondrial [Leptopilina heterotoma]